VPTFFEERIVVVTGGLNGEVMIGQDFGEALWFLIFEAFEVCDD